MTEGLEKAALPKELALSCARSVSPVMHNADATPLVEVAPALGDNETAGGLLRQRVHIARHDHARGLRLQVRTHRFHDLIMGDGPHALRVGIEVGGTEAEFLAQSAKSTSPSSSQAADILPRADFLRAHPA